MGCNMATCGVTWGRVRQSQLYVHTGHSPGADDVREFASLDDAEKIPDVCNASDSAPSCVVIPVQHLSFHLHDNHTYYLTLKTEGANGLESAVVSQPYLHRAQHDTASVRIRTCTK